MTKLLVKDLRQRLWIAVLVLIIGFVTLPVGAMMIIRNARAQQSGITIGVSLAEIAEDAGRGLTGLFSAPSAILVMAAVVAAFMAAGSGFHYLHSVRSNDFYGSLAIKREKLFFTFFLSGALLVLVPIFLDWAAAGIIAAASGFLPVTFGFGSFIVNFLYHALYFLAVYAMVSLGMLLAGRTFIGLILGAVMLGYAPFIKLLTIDLSTQFFSTYYNTAGAGTLQKLSPAAAALAEGGNPDFWTVSLGWLAVCLILCFFAAGRRPAEAAGNAFLFDRMQSVIKVLCGIPSALFFGDFMGQILINGAGRGIYFLYTGIGALIISVIMDLFMNLNAFSIFKKWRSTLVILGGALLILVAFRFDITGFDSYLPGESEIREAGISSGTEMTCQGDSYWNSSDSFYNGGYDGMDGEKAELINSETENWQPIYQLAEEGIQNLKSDQITSVEEETVCQVNVTFVLKNGKRVYRTYSIPAEHYGQTLEELSQDEDYRKQVYFYRQLAPEFVTTMEVHDMDDFFSDGTEVSLSQEEAEEFCRLVKEDSMKLSMKDYLETDPVCMIYPAMDEQAAKEADREEWNVSDFYLYPQFTESIAFLKEKGVDLSKRTDSSEVSEILAAVYDESGEDSETTDTAVDTVVDVDLAYHKITDREEIEKIINGTKRTYEWSDLIGRKGQVHLIIRGKGTDISDENDYTIEDDSIKEIIAKGSLTEY
ncbi:MAG: DUF6449 domain-containing protein [Eubacterium sp.]|nr:DUF6449 domain-containing protein [Eubacterium sp.]